MQIISEKFQSDAQKPFPALKGLEARITKATRRKIDHEAEDLIMGVFNEVECAFNANQIKNISQKFLNETEQIIRDGGGELRISRLNIPYFRVEKGKPIVAIPAEATEPVLRHEFQHFKDWQKIQAALIAQGKSAREAGTQAGDQLVTPEGVLMMESNGKKVELMAMRDELLVALEKNENENENVVQLFINGVQRHIPFDVYFRPEDLIYHLAYPKMEKLRKIFRLTKDLDRLRWKLSSFPSTRSKLQEKLNRSANETASQMESEATELKNKLIFEQRRMAVEATELGDQNLAKSHETLARALEHTTLYDQILHRHNLSIPGLGIEFDRYVKSKLKPESYTSPLTQITAVERTEIENLLKTWNSYGNGPKRVGMFRRNNDLSNVEDSSFQQLDLDALGFSSPQDLISKSRISAYLASSLVDVIEIQRRQGAVRELLESESLLTKRLGEIYKSSNSKTWMHTFMAKFQPDLTEHFYGRAYDILSKRASKDLYVRTRAQKHMTEIALFFTEIRAIREKIRGADSPRLRELAWVLDSCFLRSHSDSIAELVENLLGNPSLENRVRTFVKIMELHRSTLNQVEEAWAELAMYYDIANNALNRGWSTFPKVLEPDSAIGPILKINNFHSPRYLEKSPTTSVPNSVELGVHAGRHMIITGPNGKGKTTVQRALAQEIVPTQLGSPVAAESAEQTPLNIVAFVHPKDSPKDDLSLFMSQGKVLLSIYNKALENPFTLVLMDEILPGAISEIREDVESEFLWMLDQTGAITVTATHNWGTTSLEGQALSNSNGDNEGRTIQNNSEAYRDASNSFNNGEPPKFRNYHVDQYQLKPGAASDLGSMYEGAIEALRKVGWPEDVLEKIRLRGEKRIAKMKETK
ncbi:MAG: mismatch repair protein MutS [Bacteriovoracaceae bacterium]|nr:mismatch repair protein MutS [Bacteriovoracaceae bacterium]